MYCFKCGKSIPDGARFCQYCGSSTTGNETNIKSVRFICKGCNSVMDITTDSQIIKCPCCGSSELIIESDNVTIERIRSKTVLEHQKSDHELELEKLYYEERREERKKSENGKK